MLKLTGSSKIISAVSIPAVDNAIRILRRDMDRMLISEEPGGSVVLLMRESPPEQFTLTAIGDKLTVSAGDTLGLIYGLLEISRRFLGVTDLWFWNDQHFEQMPFADVPENFHFTSAPFAVRFRGWFINDEVLLNAWSVDGDHAEPWRMAFEALLRLGGNLVIPGTDHNAHRYRALAASYGLIITHHHAEPLGAEMFARAYPELKASYRLYPDYFEGLWRDAVEEQKDTPTIFSIGFRGQGDMPFWENDSTYDTPEKRGELMSSLILKQYDIVRSLAPGALCCTNLYGEVMELYRGGYLVLPEDVIRIWADNGYGRMVSRRQGNHDPRIPSVPDGSPGRHGIYYHVSFYDLQAASHITLLPTPPEAVARELTKVLNANGGDMWIINCSNVKPHVYMLSFIAEIWKNGTADPGQFGTDYFSEYYDPQNAAELYECQRSFWSCAPAFGPEDDQRGGDQYPNYTVRNLITQFHRDREAPCAELQWACDSDSFSGQLAYFLDVFEDAGSRFGAHVRQCEEILPALPSRAACLFLDTVMLQARLLLDDYSGSARAVRAMLLALEGRYRDAFYMAGRARESFLSADRAMRDREHGKWQGFYANECLTDTKFTACIIDGLMAALRALGDGPEYWRWQHECVCPPSDRGVVLLTNSENHMSCTELYERMRAEKGE